MATDEWSDEDILNCILLDALDNDDFETVDSIHELMNGEKQKAIPVQIHEQKISYRKKRKSSPFRHLLETIYESEDE